MLISTSSYTVYMFLPTSVFVIFWSFRNTYENGLASLSIVGELLSKFLEKIFDVMINTPYSFLTGLSLPFNVESVLFAVYIIHILTTVLCYWVTYRLRQVTKKIEYVNQDTKEKLAMSRFLVLDDGNVDEIQQTIQRQKAVFMLLAKEVHNIRNELVDSSVKVKEMKKFLKYIIIHGEQESERTLMKENQVFREKSADRYCGVHESKFTHAAGDKDDSKPPLKSRIS
ncbi:uncharacterized protein [Periplaneta americana]|uniref:uncharacterized protein n=1 Tax=Periplaneta americana TaxID=6978 RepID=UPI0037E817F4